MNPSASGPSLAVLDSSYGDVTIEREAAEALGVVLFDIRDRGSERPDPDGVLVQFATIGARELDAHPTWRVVGRYGVGVDTIDVAAATERGVAVVNVPDYCDEEVSTHAAALVLALARKLPASASLVSTGRWSDWDLLRPIRALSECTLGILGVGRIGRATIERLRPFFGSIIAHDPVAPAPDGVVAVGLDELFERADVVSLHCPLTAKSHHVVDARRLQLMRPGSFLVNVSRGGLVDADALDEALRSGWLGGAAIDVLEVEPPRAGDAVTDAPNLLVTNHIAWYSTASEARLRRLLAERCAAVLVELPVASIVNGAALGCLP